MKDTTDTPVTSTTTTTTTTTAAIGTYYAEDLGNGSFNIRHKPSRGNSDNHVCFVDTAHHTETLGFVKFLTDLGITINPFF